MESLNKGRFFETIVYNQYNQVAAYLYNVCTTQGGGLIFENSSVESDCREKSAVNSSSDIYIEQNCLLG